MIKFYVSHGCKHNFHVTPFEKNDLIWIFTLLQYVSVNTTNI